MLSLRVDDIEFKIFNVLKDGKFGNILNDSDDIVEINIVKNIEK